MSKYAQHGGGVTRKEHCWSLLGTYAMRAALSNHGRITTKSHHAGGAIAAKPFVLRHIVLIVALRTSSRHRTTVSTTREWCRKKHALETENAQARHSSNPPPTLPVQILTHLRLKLLVLGKGHVTCANTGELDLAPDVLGVAATTADHIGNDADHTAHQDDRRQTSPRHCFSA